MARLLFHPVAAAGASVEYRPHGRCEGIGRAEGILEREGAASDQRRIFRGRVERVAGRGARGLACDGRGREFGEGGGEAICAEDG